MFILELLDTIRTQKKYLKDLSAFNLLEVLINQSNFEVEVLITLMVFIGLK